MKTQAIYGIIDFQDKIEAKSLSLKCVQNNHHLWVKRRMTLC